MTYVVKNDWTFDVEKMQAQIQELISTVTQLGLGKSGLVGISLTTQDGTLESGSGFTLGIQLPPFHEQKYDSASDIKFNLDYAKENNVYHMLDYTVPTIACTGYFKQIIDFLYEKNMNPCRCRLSCLPAGEDFGRHSDGGGFKIHIPIYSQGTRWTTDDIESEAMIEGVGYIADVTPYHSVTNTSDQDRWHFIADVYDTDGNFPIGKLTQQELELERENAMLWRDYVDGKRTSPNTIKLFHSNL